MYKKILSNALQRVLSEIQIVGTSAEGESVMVGSSTPVGLTFVARKDGVKTTFTVYRDRYGYFSVVTTPLLLPYNEIKIDERSGGYEIKNFKAFSRHIKYIISSFPERSKNFRIYEKDNATKHSPAFRRYNVIVNFEQRYVPLPKVKQTRIRPGVYI